MPATQKSIKKSLVTRIITFLLLIIFTIALAAIAKFYFASLDILLVFLPVIILSSWFGGFILGFITILISMSSLLAMLFFPVSHPLLQATPVFFTETCSFFLITLFTSYLIHKAAQIDKIIDYQRRLRQTHQIIEVLEKNYDNAKNEIQARDQFLAIASHELKTPVTSMLLQVQTAIHNIRNVSLANFSVATLLSMLEDTEQQSKRLSKMVNDLLDLSLITTGKVDLEYEETNVTAITQSVAERFNARLINNKQITVLMKKPVIGFFDKLRLEQVIVNLISNAIKYGNNKPITIKISNSSDRALLSISDQGIGIPQDQQKKIFNRFERAVSSRDYKGLGVGLYITYQIVKAHNGKIHIESHMNRGSTFTLELPLKPSKKS